MCAGALSGGARGGEMTFKLWWDLRRQKVLDFLVHSTGLMCGNFGGAGFFHSNAWKTGTRLR
jgi:hypothetical protein